MEAAGAARPACGQKPQPARRRGHLHPASRGRVGPAGPRPDSCAAGCSPRPGPGGSRTSRSPARGRRVAAAQRTASGRGAERGRAPLGGRAPGPGPRGSRCPGCGPGSVGARDVGQVVLGHPFPLAPAGAEQWGSHKRPGVHQGDPSPNTQGQTAGPHWLKHTLAPQRLSRAKSRARLGGAAAWAGPGGSPTQRQPSRSQSA